MSHLLPVKVPLPLIQIATGATPRRRRFQVDFDPHIFAVVYPAAVFLDGWRIPKRRLFPGYEADSVAGDRPGDGDDLGIGLFIHWLIPAITVVAGFALAAILSPIRSVAVSAMTANSPLPRIAHILEGESLLNDASGLVA